MTDDNSPHDGAGTPYRQQEFGGADFSGRDLRGFDFSGADLRSASFRDAKLGVAPRVATVILASAILVAIGVGVAIGWAVDRMRDRLSADQWDEVAEGSSIGLMLLVLIVLILWRGFDVAIRVAFVLYVVVLALNVVANLLWEEFEWLSALRATALVVFLALAITVGMLGRVVGGVFGSWSVALVAVLGGFASGRADGGAAGVVVAVSMAIISKRAVHGDRRDGTLRRIAHRLIGRWGTQFVNADLTGADFIGTDGSRCTVTGATMVDVIWDPNLPLPLEVPERTPT